jgi:predicted transcriptional regulator
MNPETKVEELMSRPVRRLSMNARLEDAAEFLRRWGISGAPVVDHHGRPVGVFSFRDLAGHFTSHFEELPVIDPAEERTRKSGEPIPMERGLHFERISDARVSDLMTPALICVDPEAPVLESIRMMQERSIHRIFVRRGSGPLLGVLTTMDILRWIGGAPVAGRKKAPRRKVS